MTWYALLFYFLFVLQIFLISYHFPEKILSRLRKLLDEHPPQQYPRLYPQSAAYFELSYGVFKVLNRLIVGFGLLLLVAMIGVVDHSTFADDGFISEAWPAFYGVIQGIPFVLLEFLGFRQLRLMRKQQVGTKRRAELRPRRLLDHASPKLVAMASLFYLGSILVDLYVHDFIFHWSHDTFQRTLWLTIGILFMVAVGSVALYGRKPDPHQSDSDRARQNTAVWTSLLYVSAAMSLFNMVNALDDVFDLNFLDAALMSVYFQVIVVASIGHMLKHLRLEDIDFDVYKAETPAP